MFYLVSCMHKLAYSFRKFSMVTLRSYVSYNVKNNKNGQKRILQKTYCKFILQGIFNCQCIIFLELLSVYFAKKKKKLCESLCDEVIKIAWTLYSLRLRLYYSTYCQFSCIPTETDEMQSTRNENACLFIGSSHRLQLS